MTTSISFSKELNVSILIES